METCKLNTVVLFLFILASGEVVAQQTAEIKGDTVFVNSESEVLIKLPSDNIDLRWTDLNPPYAYSSAPNSLLLHAKNDDAKCSRLNVFEGPGPRSHNFVICFKKEIPRDIYDFSTVKKLQVRVKEITEIEAKKGTATSSTASVAKAQTPKPASAGSTSGSNSTSRSHYAVLEEADAAFKNSLFDDAQLKYEEVLRMAPDNDYAKKKLSDIKVKKAEKEELARKEAESKINGMKADANKAFASKQYDEALDAYNSILAINPNDTYSKSQVALIKKFKSEKELKEQQEKERLAKKEQDDKIKEAKARATRAFNEKQYDEAIIAYNAVMTLDPSDATIKSKLEAIEKIKEQEALKTKKERENKDQQETFEVMVRNADKAFTEKDYDVARAGYLAAKDVRPADAALDKKIKAVDDKIAGRQNEDIYVAFVSEGDKAMKAGDLEKAKEEYLKASRLYKDRPYPQEKINEINKNISTAAARKKEEDQRQGKELDVNNKYKLAIEKADKELENKAYASAKTIYLQAAVIKPEEEYPKNKLAEIAGILESLEKDKKAKVAENIALAEVDKKYNSAMEKGKSAFEKSEFNTAKEAFNLALKLKPDAKEPLDKLEAIDRKVAGEDVNSKYEAALAKANLALVDKNYSVALESYKQALRIKPVESYPLKQVNFVQDLITTDSIQQVANQRRAELRAQEEIRKKRFDEGMNAYANYELAAQTANYEDELKYLKHFLNIIPDASDFNNYQFNAGAKLDFSRKKIKSIRDYLTRVKGEAYQMEVLPYLDKELEGKYEAINFHSPPDEQLFDKLDTTSVKDIAKTGKQLLIDKHSLDVADSAANIKLTVNGIIFKGDRVFYKLRIQNRDSEDFLTGPIQLTHSKKNGKAAIKSNPYYTSAYPIILPGKEFYIIYAAKDLLVEDSDTLAFDLKDRLKKKTIKVSIPGKVYNQEKKSNVAVNNN